ncbi:MAG: PEP-CTERM sorting domain-containing protein [Shimia sp.]|nr:PEP-CTERM sorting domain-containing protein [Shimia sp.]
MVDAAPVEPGALVMFGLVVGLGGMGRRRRRRSA